MPKTGISDTGEKTLGVLRVTLVAVWIQYPSWFKDSWPFSPWFPMNTWGIPQRPYTPLLNDKCRHQVHQVHHSGVPLRYNNTLLDCGEKKDVYKFIELDEDIYRKSRYLMVKTMVSCRFSLNPLTNSTEFGPQHASEIDYRHIQSRVRWCGETISFSWL